MRNPCRRPFSLDAIREREVHELLRDFPELLPLFDQLGVRTREEGNETADPGLFVDDGSKDGILTRILWRTYDGA